MKHVYTITKKDIGKPIIIIKGKPHLVSDFLGQILDQDVGKRVYNINGVLSVENQEQFKKHLCK